MSVNSRPIIVLALLFAAACTDHSVRNKAADYLALRYAAEAGDEPLARALLERGTPVDPLDIDAAGELTLGVAEADSPLQIAAKRGHTEIVRLLLQHHPWVDHRCCTAPSALVYAAENGHAGVVRLLLDAGADASIASDAGTALESAQRAGHTDVVAVLNSNVATSN